MPRVLHRLVCVSALSLAVAAPAFAERGPLPPGDHTRPLPYKRLSRGYVLHLPPAAAQPAPLPLVLAFHGGGGNAAGFQKYAGLDAVADREGFAVVYPDGTGPFLNSSMPVPPALQRLFTWNAGRCCGWSMDEKIDDVGFSLRVVEAVEQVAHIDSARVYATGHSNGAMMAYRLAAEAADRIAAIVPVGGAMNLKQPFAPARAVPLLHIHSVSDPRAPFGGGDRESIAGVKVHHEPALAGLQLWEKRNGCNGKAKQLEQRSIPAPNGMGEHSALHIAAACPENAPVELWRLAGPGHGWPGDNPGPLPESVMGPHSNVISAAEEVWKFAKRFRLPGRDPGESAASR
jgi:polyhydroxybutyrate depolymerase